MTAEATQLAGADAQPTPVRGLTPPSQEGGRGGFLSDVVVELGFAGEEAVERAVCEARDAGRTVDAALLEAGVLDETQLARAIAEHHGFAYADLDEFEVDPTAVRLISRTAALRYRAAPIAVSGDGDLLVAFVDPVDVFAVNDIEVTTRSNVRPVVAAASAIEALIATIPKEAAGSLNGHPGERVEGVAPPLAEGPIAGEEPTVPPDPSPATSSAAEPSSSTDPPLAEPALPPLSPSGPARSRSEDPSPRWQEKIASLIEGALEGVAESEMAELEGELGSARAEIEELGAQLDTARRQEAENAEREEALRAQLGSANAEIEELGAQLDTARRQEAENAEREEALRAQFSAAQQAGGKLKETLSSLRTVASEARVAADALEEALSDPHSAG